MTDVTFKDIDMDLLEKQRLTIMKMLFNKDLCDKMTTEEEQALQGIVNMLDFWSDEIYFGKQIKL